MATTNMKKLSAYTIAKNCSDLDDVYNGLEEMREYFALCSKDGKKPTASSYIRLFKLKEKEEKFLSKK
jgi:hypothetical protein